MGIHRLHLLLTVVFCLCAVGACGEPAKDQIPQARYIALRDQDTVRLDEKLEREVRAVLGRVFEFDPTLSCGAVKLPFVLGTIDIYEAPLVAATAWRNGEIFTGIEEIDNVIEEFSIASVSSVRYGFVWEFDNELNPVNLAALLSALLPDLHAEALPPGGDGDDITIERTSDGHQVRVEHGTGDCLAGCINEHYWLVFVPGSETAPVTLIEEGGYEFSTEDLELWCNRQ